MWKLKSNLLFLIISINLNVLADIQSSAPLSSLEDTLSKKIQSALNLNDINSAVSYYDDIFSTTFKENPKLLEKICLKSFELSLLSKEKSVKLNILKLIAKFINIPLGKILIKTFKDRDEEVRELSVDILSKFNNDVLYPDISAGLKSSDFNMILSSLDFIFKVKEKSFISQIKPLLDHEDVFVKVNAIKTISILNPDDEIIDSLNKLLNHPSDRIRSAVVEGFCFIESDKINIDDIIKDGSERVIISMLHWAEINPSEKADSIIRRGLLNKNERVYSKACKAALQSDDMIDRVSWEKLIGSSQKKLRMFAVKAMSKKNELFDDDEIIYKCLDDTNEEVGNFVANKLIESKDPFVETLIEDILNSGTNRGRRALINAWKNNKEIACPVKILKKLLVLDHSFLQEIAIPLMSSLPIEEQISFIEKLKNSNKINVRASLYTFLSDEKKKDIYQKLYVSGLNDQSIKVKSATLEGVSLLNENLKKEIIDEYVLSEFAVLRKESVFQSKYFEDEILCWDVINIAKVDKNSSVRMASLETAKDLEDKSNALDLYSSLLFDDDYEIRSFALKELQSPGAEDAVEEKDNIKDKNIEQKKDKNNKEEKTDVVVALNKKKSKKNSKMMSWLKMGKTSAKKNNLDLSLKKNVLEGVDLSVADKKKKRNGLSKQLKKLLNSRNSELSSNAEDLLLEMGDEQSLKNIKNRITDDSVEERRKAAKKLGFLNDTSLIPVLREQLKYEKDLQVQFELAFAIWKMIPNI